MGIVSRSQGGTPSRAQLVDTAGGLVTETMPLATVANNSLMTDGMAYFCGVGLIGGDVITNISLITQAGGSGVTLSKVGLYSSAGTRLGLSADQGTSWQSVGLKTVALITPVTITSTGMYYAAVISKATVTLPNLRASATSNGVSVAIGAGLLILAGQAGQTDLPSPGTPAAGNGIGFWLGLS